MDFGCAGGDRGQRHRCVRVRVRGPGRGAPGTSVWGTECGPDAQNPPPLPRLLECFVDTVQKPPTFDLSFHSLRLSAAPLAAQLKHISSPKSKPLFKLCPLSEYLTSSTRLISNGFSMKLFSATPPTPITEPVSPGTLQKQGPPKTRP